MIRIVAITVGSCTLDNMLTISAPDNEMILVGHTSDDQAALELCATLRPDIALIDMCDSNIQGLQTVKAIRATNTYIKVLVLSPSEEPEYARAVLRLGVSGYLLRDDDLGDLVLSIRTVYSGQVVCSSSITRALIQPFLKQ